MFAMLETISWISLTVSLICALIIAGDELRRPQKMRIMNIVWPVTALYFSVVALWGYYRIGRKMARDATQGMPEGQMKGDKNQLEEQGSRRDPTWEQTAVSDSHFGAAS